MKNRDVETFDALINLKTLMLIAKTCSVGASQVYSGENRILSGNYNHNCDVNFKCRADKTEKARKSRQITFFSSLSVQT